MKDRKKLYLISFVLLSVFLITSGFHEVYGQAKKNKVRLKADYVKLMDREIYLDIKATSKIEKKNVKVPNIEVTIYNEFNDEEIELGTTITNMKGESKFVIKDLSDIKADSTNVYNIILSFRGNDYFKKASKSISFKDAEIKANLLTKDSLNYIKATLIDKSKDSVIVGESLDVQVQRLFRSLKIGEEFNNTDESGTIIVPIEEGIPGVDGNLTIEVVLNDHDEFGTVKTFVNAPIGTPIVDESTFDQRTMWSPRNKTPMFILIFTNLLIIGIWSILLYLTINLFKISKTKN